MSAERISEQPIWPYSERNGVGVAHDVEVLLAEPEIILSDAEKAEAAEFARQLFDGYVTDDLQVSDPAPVGAGESRRPRSLGAINKISIAESETFYTDYFATDDGTSALETLSFDLSDIDSTDNSAALADKSRDWHIAQLRERLRQPAENDANQPNPNTSYYSYDPNKLLDKCGQLQAYRQFYREVRGQLHDEANPNLAQAKTVLLDLHVARVNGLMAGYYPTLLKLAAQFSDEQSWTRAIDEEAADAELDGLIDKLHAVAPLAARAMYVENRSTYTGGINARMDGVRNGFARASDGTLGPVSNEVIALANELDAKRGEPAAAAVELDPELRAELAERRWKAEDTKQFVEAVLDEWGLLSAKQDDWNAIRKRSGATDDDRWQAVVTPKRTALAVDGIKKVVLIPEKFDRPLASPHEASALPVIGHELEHVLQSEQDQNVAAAIPLAVMKGRRSIATREMGGIYQERIVCDRLGLDRPVNTTYLRALEAKVAGANRTQAARAFLEASSPDQSLESRIKIAGDRVLRLYRNGGHNSQPLDYIEQELILRGLNGLSDEQVMVVATAGGSFSLRDTAELHRVGLLDLPQTVDRHPADDVLRIYFERFHRAK